MAPTADERLPAGQVLATIGTPCGVSSLGTVETRQAWVCGDDRAIAFAAFDAGLVTIEGSDDEPLFVVREGPERGKMVDAAWIEERFGPRLRSRMGIRALDGVALGELPADLGASLPHDLERGGLRELAGLTYNDVRDSAVRDMAGLFQDEPYLGPSVQAQLFLYGGLGALSSLPRPLPEIVPHAHDFRVAAGCAFPGLEHIEYLSLAMQPNAGNVKRGDRLAYRLSSSLNTHGPALLTALLSPVYSLSKVRRNPELLEALVCADTGLRNVPQAPLVASGACASALLALADVAPQLMAGPKLGGPHMVLWTAADAALQPDARVIEGFGAGALATRSKLEEINAGRGSDEKRPVSAALAPFDRDAMGTVLGHAGSGVLVTTLEFAVEHDLDVSALIVGWGQSGETGGKGHFAGVGFGGENALIRALEMAHRAHGYGVESFGHVVPHATGTRTNSQTDLSLAARALGRAAARQGAGARSGRISVGAPKALGDGHTMGEAGLRSAAEGIYYLSGMPSAGVPSFMQWDSDLEEFSEQFRVEARPVPGNTDGGVLTYAQGFGGYVAALAMRGAHPDALRRYRFRDPARLDAYCERIEERRRERIASERRARRRRGGILELVQRHRWK